MSEAQAMSPLNPPSQPKLMALPQPSPAQVTLSEDLVAAIVDKKIQNLGIPAPIAHDMTQTIEKAAKKVPSWVLWLMLAFGTPLVTGIYAQYETYKDLPDRMSKVEIQLNRIEDLLSPTSRPKTTQGSP